MPPSIDSIANILDSSQRAIGKDLTQYQNLINNFGIDAPLLFAQVINFCIVASLLYYFGFKPMLTTIDSRQKKIADGIKYTEEAERCLASTEKHCSERVQQASQESKKIIQEACNAARTYHEHQVRKTELLAQETMKKAQHSIEFERQAMINETRKKAVNLVITTTAKVLGRELKDLEVKQFGRAAIKEISSKKI